MEEIQKIKKCFSGLKVFRVPVLVIIGLYQLTISPDHSRLGRIFFPEGYCRYWPSCSKYSFQAIYKYGLLRGSFLAIKRIFRCNPWSPGGVDELN